MRWPIALRACDVSRRPGSGSDEPGPDSSLRLASSSCSIMHAHATPFTPRLILTPSGNRSESEAGRSSTSAAPLAIGPNICVARTSGVAFRPQAARPSRTNRAEAISPSSRPMGFQRRAGRGATGQVGGYDRAFGVGGEGRRAFLAALLAIPFDGRYAPLDMAPPEQKERTIAALIALFEGLTKDVPVLALLEDAHWVDPTSLDVFGRLVGIVRPIFRVVFGCGSFRPWATRSAISTALPR